MGNTATRPRGTWRSIAAPIIAEVLKRSKAEGWDDRTQRQALKAAYPFGMRQYWPYKVWLDEIALQTGRRAKAAKPHQQPKLDRERAARADPDQGKLFE